MDVTAAARSRSVAPVDEAAIQQAAQRERRRWLLRLWATRVALGVAILLIWQALGMWVVDGFWISSPALVGTRIAELAASGDLTRHLWATLEVALEGLALGMLVGVLTGVALGLVPRVATILEPYIMIFYTLPRIALAPLFIMYLGVGVLSKVVFTFTIVVFIALLNTYEGVRGVDSQLVDALRAMRASRGQIIRWVVLPSIVPWVLATLRIAIGLSLIGAVVAELISASRGIGWYMSRAAGTFDVTGVFAGMFILAFTAALINGLVSMIERRLLAWRST
jgi:NitT/TauT family transport system permease protein